MRLSVALAVVMCGLLPASASQAADATDPSCLEYEPAVVTLSGTITRHLEYGPPNYGEDPAHDEKGFYWFLDLDKPICVNGSDEDSPDEEGETGVRRLQIVYNRYPKGRGWIGHKASITGTLFHAHTAHHYTKVLIISDKTTKLPRP
jgi:hypothetical protein